MKLVITAFFIRLLTMYAYPHKDQDREQLGGPSGDGFNCEYGACDCSEGDTQCGFYGNMNCAECRKLCSNDDKCGAVWCASGLCQWHEAGHCKPTPNDFFQVCHKEQCKDCTTSSWWCKVCPIYAKWGICQWSSWAQNNCKKSCDTCASG